MQNEEDWAPLRRPSRVEAQCRPLCRQQPADLLLLRMLHSQLKRDDAWKSSPKSKRKPRVAVSKKHNSDGIESFSSVCVPFWHYGISRDCSRRRSWRGEGTGKRNQNPQSESVPGGHLHFHTARSHWKHRGFLSRYKNIYILSERTGRNRFPKC